MESKTAASGESGKIDDPTRTVSKSEKSNATKKVGLGGLGLKVGKSKKPVDSNKEDVNHTATNDNSKKGAPSNTTGEGTAANDNDEVKYWRATLDPTSDKLYYYNKKTKEVSWTKPVCFSPDFNKDVTAAGESTKKQVEDTTVMSSVVEKRKKTWFNKKDKKGADKGEKVEEKKVDKSATATLPIQQDVTDAKVAQETTSATNENNVDSTVKYWRATLDASTGKTYYFNKKTKMVTWTKPEGFKEKGELTSESTKKETKAAAAVEDSEQGVVDGVDAAKEQVKAVETADVALQELEDDAADGDENNAVNEQLDADDMSEIEGLSNDEAIVVVKPDRKSVV